MIAKHKLTKVTLKHNDDEITIFLGWHFVIIIILIGIIKTITKGTLQEPEQNTLSRERRTISFFSCSFSMLSLSGIILGTCPSVRDLWKLQLIDSLFYLHTEVSVFQSWNERIRSSTPIYPFTLGIVFRLALRLIVSSQKGKTPIRYLYW